MSDPAKASRAKTEAARWFVRLSRTAVTTDALREFRDWKRQAGNAAAYAQVEAVWSQAGRLAHDPDLQAATAEALRRHPARSPRSAQRAPWPLALGAAGLACALAALVWLGPGRQTTFSTRPGEQWLVVLPDRSRVRLNTDSQIQVSFRREERRILLTKGEAFFEAAHDAARPFVVLADGARVRALGTRFDVRRDAGRVRVTLVEGRVEVGHPGQAPAAILSPNQQLTVSAAGISTAHATDAAAASSWTTGRLTFHDVALQEAVAEVNRYAPHKVVLEAPAALGAAPVSGVFEVGDTKAFVAAASTLFDLQAIHDPSGEIRLRPRATPPHA